MVQWVNELISDPPLASQEAIRDAEEEFGVRFPADYLEIARVHQGAQPVPNEVAVPDYGVTGVAHLLHFEEKPGFSNIVTRYFPLEGAMEPGVVPFAEDIGGDFFCFDYRQDAANPSVVFWCVDTGPVYLADNFTAFLDILRPDENE